MGRALKLSTEEFIKRGITKFGNTYSYIHVVYVNMITKIKLVCNKCNTMFETTPVTHLLRTGGCVVCANKMGGDRSRDTKESFTEKAIKKHGYKYDYKLVQYFNQNTNIEIICDKHGIFWQKPKHHLNGHACPQCSPLKKEKLLFNNLKEVFKKEILIRQGKPEWLIGGNKTNTRSVDIYFPDYNIAIEYQGGQHFYPVKYFGGEETFNRTKESDERKRKLCLENNCKLFYFTYKPSDIPKDYPYKVHINEQELINKIKEEIVTGIE